MSATFVQITGRVIVMKICVSEVNLDPSSNVLIIIIIMLSGSVDLGQGSLLELRVIILKSL